MIRHPKYTRTLHYNDIALIELAKAVPFCEQTFPACLWTDANENFIQKKPTISACGFGVKRYGGMSNTE
jgi:Trypsin